MVDWVGGAVTFTDNVAGEGLCFIYEEIVACQVFVYRPGNWPLWGAVEFVEVGTVP